MNTEIITRVAGVTFCNADGSSRQELLAHIFDTCYAHACVVCIVETDFEDSTALRIDVPVSDGRQLTVGFIPKQKIPAFQKYSGKKMTLIVKESVIDDKVIYSASVRPLLAPTGKQRALANQLLKKCRPAYLTYDRYIYANFIAIALRAEI